MNGEQSGNNASNATNGVSQTINYVNASPNSVKVAGLGLTRSREEISINDAAEKRQKIEVASSTSGGTTTIGNISTANAVSTAAMNNARGLFNQQMAMMGLNNNNNMAGSSTSGSGAMDTSLFLQSLPPGYAAMTHPAVMSGMSMQTQQQQLQFAAAMAAQQRNVPATQQQQQAMMAAMMNQNYNNRVVAAIQAQQQLNTASAQQIGIQAPVNIHTSSVMPARPTAPTGLAVGMSGNGSGYPHTATPGAVTPQSATAIQQKQQALLKQASAAKIAASSSSGKGSPKVDVTVKEEPCLICQKKIEDDLFVCNGGCDQRLHRACIGEEALFPSVVGHVCGNCHIMQQNRASKEDLRKGGTNGISVRRAILCLNLETNSQSNFDKFGHLASLRLMEIGEIAGYPIKPFAEKFVEPYLQRWIREKLSNAERWALNVREIFTLMIGLYSLKKACIAHGMNEKIIALVKARNFSVTDYLGWHPSIEGPSVRCSSICAICGIRNPPETTCLSFGVYKIRKQLASDILCRSDVVPILEQVGIPLGTTTLDVFAHTNSVRAGYKGLRPIDADGVGWDLFADQLRMIFGFLDVVSNFGVLQLNPSLFEPEVKIIYNAAYVNQAMLATEYEVVGKFLQCMRLFGPAKVAENYNLIVGCERFLLLKQLPNGSWCKMNGTTVDQYKATVTCSKALVTPVFHGCGPKSGEFHRLLEKWAKTAAGNKQENSAKLLVCGATMKGNARTGLKRLEAVYKRHMIPSNDENPLERLVTGRLLKILSSKKQKPVGEVKESDKEIKPEHADEKTSDNKGGDTTGTEESSSPDDNADILEEKAREEEDALTNLSLNEDLEIFDGLKFEDGDVIYVDSQNERAIGMKDDDDDHQDADGDATDTAKQDDDVGDGDDLEDNVYDDDDDETDEQPVTGEERPEMQGSDDDDVNGMQIQPDGSIMLTDTSAADLSLDT